MKYVKPSKLYEDVLKLKNTGPLLGLHVGKEGVGVAISDDSKIVAEPFMWVARTHTNIDFVASEFQTLISEHSPLGLVIGYPYEVRRNSPFRKHLINRFVGDLTKIRNFEDVKYTFRDESYTTKMFYEWTSYKPCPNEWKFSDEFAAYQVLQEYLDKGKQISSHISSP